MTNETYYLVPTGTATATAQPTAQFVQVMPLAPQPETVLTTSTNVSAQATNEDVIALAEQLYKEMRAQALEESEVTNTSVASHDETEDVKLAEQAIEFLRELLVREAKDGTSIWQLDDLISALKAVNWVKLNEESDIIEDQLSDTPLGFASEESDQIFTGGEDMALTEEARAELNEAVVAANAPVVEAVNNMATAMTAALASLAELLKPAAPAPAEEAAAEDAVVEETVAEAATEAATDPIVEQPTAQAEFPPKKKEDEEEDEEDESDAGEQPAAEEDTVVQASESADDEEDEPSDEEYAAAQHAVIREQVSSGARSIDLGTEAGRKAYLEGVAKANRLPVGIVSDLGGTEVGSAPTADDYRKALVNIFRRN